jgi:TonB-linked SusC/RagA family outer membrane protein
MNSFQLTKTSLLKTKGLLFLILSVILSTLNLFAQERTITGNVLDENKNPFPGVYITVKGTTTGTITNNEGVFKLNNLSNEDVLVLSFMGYKKQEINVGNSTEFNVALEPESIGLDEVVAIGYGTKKKSDLTGAVVHIKASEMQETPIVNLADALKGRAAGVVVSSNSGAPGASPSILIRGMSSIQAGNQPLLIVDGMPSDMGMLNQINMNDVESFEVLKDASSTAIYGSAGANGVILLNTKRGKPGKTKIDFSLKYGTRHFPESKKVLNSQQFYNYLNEIDIITDAFGDNYFANYDSVSLSTIDTANMVDVNWQDEMFDVGNFQEYSLSFSGGKENLAYVVSGSYLKDIGIISPAEFERYTFLANIDNKIGNRIKLSGNAYYSHIEKVKVTESGLGWNGGMVNSALQFPPFLPINDDVTGYYFPNPIRPQVDSPKALANGTRNKGYNDNLRGNFIFSIELIKNLTFRTEFLGSVAFSRSKSFVDRHNTYDGRVYNGMGSDNTSYNFNRLFHTFLDCNNTIGKHQIQGLVGFIDDKTYGETFSMSVIDFPTDNMVLLQQANTQQSLRDGIYNFRKFSYIARFFYQYDNKYLIQSNFRADGSPIFGPSNRWAYFPTLSLAWKISEEDFFDAQWIELLKIRANLGSSGNDAISGWQWMSTYGSADRSFYPIFGDDEAARFYSPSRMANPNLKWESTFEYNFGAELNAFSGKLDLALDFYNRDSYDLLYSKPVPYTSGFPSVVINVGKVRNRGFEMALTTHNISTPDFSWKTEFTFSYNMNEVLDLGKDNEGTYAAWSVVKGQPLRSAWLYQFDRLFQEDDFTMVDGKYVLKPGIAYQPNAQPGDIKFKNNKEEGSNIIDQNDRVFLGPSQSPISGGLNNNINYKNFSLTLFFQGVHGNMIYNETRITSEGMGDYFNQYETVLDRWTHQNTNTTIPRATAKDLNNNKRESDRWLEPGWYLRMRDVTLSYSIPKSLLSSVGLGNAILYVTGQNWLTFTKYSGFDPEVGSSDNGNYPQVSTLIFGANISF